MFYGVINDGKDIIKVYAEDYNEARKKYKYNFVKYTGYNRSYATNILRNYKEVLKPKKRRTRKP
ncbi:MAG: hypothetical protein MJB14_04905, partial [Spirochaetes bacterium]|nr:hypothetical protein [Spirochaetota bacterium]